MYTEKMIAAVKKSRTRGHSRSADSGVDGRTLRPLRQRGVIRKYWPSDDTNGYRYTLTAEGRTLRRVMERLSRAELKLLMRTK